MIDSVRARPSAVVTLLMMTAALAGAAAHARQQPAEPSPLSLAVAAFADPDFVYPGKISALVVVAVGVDAGGVRRFEAADRSVDLDIAVTDGRGRRIVHAEPAQRLAGIGGVTEHFVRLVLPPGDYRVRASLRAVAAAWKTQAEAELSIPNYLRAPLALSDLVLSTTLPESLTKGPTAGLLPVMPTALRSFAAGQSVTAFVRLYAGPDEPITPVTVTAAIADSRNRVVFTDRTPATPARARAIRIADFRIELPLARLDPGAYVLTIRAQTPSRSDVVRRTAFRLE